MLLSTDFVGVEGREGRRRAERINKNNLLITDY
jgi:hypothetical protein